MAIMHVVIVILLEEDNNMLSRLLTDNFLVTTLYKTLRISAAPQQRQHPAPPALPRRRFRHPQPALLPRDWFLLEGRFLCPFGRLACPPHAGAAITPLKNTPDDHRVDPRRMREGSWKARQPWPLMTRYSGRGARVRIRGETYLKTICLYSRGGWLSGHWARAADRNIPVVYAVTRGICFMCFEYVVCTHMTRSDSIYLES